MRRFQVFPIPTIKSYSNQEDVFEFVIPSLRKHVESYCSEAKRIADEKAEEKKLWVSMGGKVPAEQLD